MSHKQDTGSDQSPPTTPKKDQEQTSVESTQRESSSSTSASRQPHSASLFETLRTTKGYLAFDYERFTDNFELQRWQNEIAAAQQEIHNRRVSETHHAHPMAATPPQKNLKTEAPVFKDENKRPLSPGKGKAPMKEGQKNRDDISPGADTFGFDGSRSPRPGRTLRNDDGTYKLFNFGSDEEGGNTTLVDTDVSTSSDEDTPDDESDEGSMTVRGDNNDSEQVAYDAQLADKLQAEEYNKHEYRSEAFFNNTRIEIKKATNELPKTIYRSSSGFGFAPAPRIGVTSNLAPIISATADNSGSLRIPPQGYRHTLVDRDDRARSKQALAERRPIEKIAGSGTKSWTSRIAAARTVEKGKWKAVDNSQSVMDSFLRTDAAAHRRKIEDMNTAEREAYDHAAIGRSVAIQKAKEAGKALEAQLKEKEKERKDIADRHKKWAVRKEKIKRWEAGDEDDRNTHEPSAKQTDDNMTFNVGTGTDVPKPKRGRKYTLVTKKLSGEAKETYAQKARRNTTSDPKHPDYIPPKTDKDDDNKDNDNEENVQTYYNNLMNHEGGVKIESCS